MFLEIQFFKHGLLILEINWLLKKYIIVNVYCLKINELIQSSQAGDYFFTSTLARNTSV